MVALNPDYDRDGQKFADSVRRQIWALRKATFGGIGLGVELEPYQAEWFLKQCDGRNRAFNGERLERFRSAIANGQRTFYSGPVMFDSSGRLVNGRHRLRACVDTGKAIQTVVLFGMNTDVVLSDISDDVEPDDELDELIRAVRDAIESLLDHLSVNDGDEKASDELRDIVEDLAVALEEHHVY